MAADRPGVAGLNLGLLVEHGERVGVLRCDRDRLRAHQCAAAGPIAGHSEGAVVSSYQ